MRSLRPMHLRRLQPTATTPKSASTYASRAASPGCRKSSRPRSIAAPNRGTAMPAAYAPANGGSNAATRKQRFAPLPSRPRRAPVPNASGGRCGSSPWERRSPPRRSKSSGCRRRKRSRSSRPTRSHPAPMRRTKSSWSSPSPGPARSRARSRSRSPSASCSRS